MRFQLIDYQAVAVSEVIGSLDEGFNRFARNAKLTAVSLSAPTGAGKTVIAAAVIESMLFGSDTVTPDPEVTFLWVTDDPSLNQQTKRKMLQASNLLQPANLIAIDQSFDQNEFDKGKVYFVHIQQLGRGATNYVRVGNSRQYSIWDTIRNTITNRGDKFVLIIDEAHKGTGAKVLGKTIASQIMDGGTSSAAPAAPVVLGISATPERFVDAISKSGQRILDPVTVDPEAVRQSGLIKDKIRIRHPRESQPGDFTLLELAVKDLKMYSELWEIYAQEQNEPLVRPALVVQVKAKASEADISQILDTVKGVWGILDGRAIAHSFQEHSTLNVGSRAVRYVAPQDIQDDENVRVVLFKEALTTGWDCPRAEVMFSQRSAQDYTYIAQLIGRMVRTPLARRISTNDVLNTVSLFLPHYDDAQVQQVITGLQNDDAQFTSTVEIDSIVCSRNDDVNIHVWDLLNSLPTYTRPSKLNRNEVARLASLAVLLAGSRLDPDAYVKARQHVGATLRREANRIGASLDDVVFDLERLDYQTQNFTWGTSEIDVETASVALSMRNIEDLFKQASRTLGDAAAMWYWDDLCEEGLDPDSAKIRVAALAQDHSVAFALEAAARGLTDTWRTQHNSAISNLHDARRAQFYALWQQSKAPQQVNILFPSSITVADVETKYSKHIFVGSNGMFPAKLTGWESDVLGQELSKPSLLGWYRNPTGGTAAIAVPYSESGQARTMYPDFLFIHETDEGIVADIIDPHRPDSADTAPKWRGLCAFAATHSQSFRKVLAVVKDADDRLLSLDLRNSDVAHALESASTEADIHSIFRQYGGTF